MSHRVHPKIFRVKNLSDWNSRWLEKKKLPQYLEEDFRIREFLKKRLGSIGIEKVEIERFPGKINIIISSARPGLIIGRGGGGVEELKKELEKIILKKRPSFTSAFVKTSADKSADKKASAVPSEAPSKSERRRGESKEIKIEIREIKNPWLSASLSAQWIVQQIEKRVPHRRILKHALEKISVNKEVQGARIEVAGRLGGKEIARREWLKKGRLPRQTLRADIDYAQDRAYCTYGVIGVKVWIYKGERFE